MSPSVRSGLAGGIGDLSPPVRRVSDDSYGNGCRRASDAGFSISNCDPRHPIFSNFRVRPRRGRPALVEIRDLRRREFTCDCADFRLQDLDTCPHVEAVLRHLERRFKRKFREAMRHGSSRMDLVPDYALNALRLTHANGSLPDELRGHFDDDGVMQNVPADEWPAILERLAEAVPNFRASQEVASWLNARRRLEHSRRLRSIWEERARDEAFLVQETQAPLSLNQREGMYHLAFTERAWVADDRQTGRIVPAIAACALLHQTDQVRRVLVVTSVSQRCEWKKQIRRFTPLAYQFVFGSQDERLRSYARASAFFFTIAHYEQLIADGPDITAKLRPDVVVLDEVLRFHDWRGRTGQALRHLRSRYAFALAEGPVLNGFDDGFFALMDWIEPAVFGSRFRFAGEFCRRNKNGNFAERIGPYLLNRCRGDSAPVANGKTLAADTAETRETGPGRLRTDRHAFDPLTR